MSTDHPRSKCLSFKVRPHEARLLTTAADLRRTTRSEFIRDNLLPLARKVVAGEDPGDTPTAGPPSGDGGSP